MIWTFFEEQILGMKWLNQLICSFLGILGLDVTEKLGGSILFFILDRKCFRKSKSIWSNSCNFSWNSNVCRYFWNNPSGRSLTYKRRTTWNNFKFYDGSNNFKFAFDDYAKKSIKTKVVRLVHRNLYSGNYHCVEISAFLQYICDKKPVDDFTKRFSSIVEKIKKHEVNRKEYQSMNLHDRDNFRRGKKEGLVQGYASGISVGISQGISQGAHEKAIETAKNMLNKKISIDVIIECTGLSEKTVEELANSL